MLCKPQYYQFNNELLHFIVVARVMTIKSKLRNQSDTVLFPNAAIPGFTQTELSENLDRRHFFQMGAKSQQRLACNDVIHTDTDG